MHSGTKIGLWAVATMVAALWASPAVAAFSMTINETDGHTTTSGSVVSFASDSLGFISNSLGSVGMLGNAIFNVSTAVEMVTPTEVSADLLTFASVPIQPVDPLTLTINVTLNDLTLSSAASPILIALTLAADGSAWPGESVGLTAALDTNDLGRISGSGVSAISFAGHPGSFSTAGSPPSTLVSLAGAPQTHPFSLSLVETLQFSAPGAVVLNSSVDPGSTPEPSTLALLGVGLLGFGVFRRRRGTAR